MAVASNVPRATPSVRRKDKAAGEPLARLVVGPLEVPGLADDIIRHLSGLATWLTISFVAETAYRLTGWAETERGRVRLCVELNDAATGRVLWSERYEGRNGLPVGVAGAIARAVPLVIGERELGRMTLATGRKRPTHDLAFLAFNAVMRPDLEKIRNADDLLWEAEDYAAPHVSTRFARVWWHLMTASQGWMDERGGRDEQLVYAMERLDPADPAAAALRAYLPSVLQRDHAQALTALGQVIDAAPLCCLAWCLKALVLCRLGQGEAAVFHAEQAQTMAVMGAERAWRDYVSALSLYIAGRYGDSVRWARISAAECPGLAANLRVMAAGLAVLGMLDEAAAAGYQVLRVDYAFRIGTWRQRSLLPEDIQAVFGQRLRLAGLPA